MQAQEPADKAARSSEGGKVLRNGILRPFALFQSEQSIKKALMRCKMSILRSFSPVFLPAKMSFTHPQHVSLLYFTLLILSSVTRGSKSVTNKSRLSCFASRSATN